MLQFVCALCLCCAVQVSPDSGLLQCSTVADLVDFKFADEQVSRTAAEHVIQVCTPCLCPHTPRETCGWVVHV
jgi:hypothetical protein